MLWWSVCAFQGFDNGCVAILVVHPQYLAQWEDMFSAEESAFSMRIEKVAGGASRIESVRNGLKKVGEIIGVEGLKDERNIVFIHDSARPLVTPELITRGCIAVDCGVGAVPTISVADSLREIKDTGEIVAVNRNRFLAVQTPQVFVYEDINMAYDNVKEEEGLTDDASVAERVGIRIKTYPGDPANFKVTTSIDLKLCEALFDKRKY